ncbi:MAG: hypothetical protein K6C94_07515 [Candidatus Gastranaerophilales bacterium]|nr:hypothetical protein [Candidatus Gastranaerophilales bacterium]
MAELQELIKEQFHKDNYIIRTENRNNAEKYAVVYCSSNGVYKTDTVEDFTKSILKIDNYEWYMTRVPYAEKHIFIRDITKRFYKFGINDKELNSIEKVTEMLKKETEGYKVITIGSSAGGSAAIIFGKLLNADFTIAFSPMLKNYNSVLSQEILDANETTKEFFNDVDYAKSDIPIFYIYPNGSEWDIYNSELLKDFENVRFLPVLSDFHGVPINKRILKKLLSCDKETLKNVIKYKTTDSVNEFRFAREIGGLGFYMFRVWDYIKKYPIFFLKKDFYTKVLR